MKKKFIIGTRGSELALIQTNIVKKILLEKFPTIQLEMKIISTRGDKDKKSPIPLDTVGKDWFSKEIDKELLQGSIDIAVHSLKDLAAELPQGLIIAAIPEREDAREVFISKDGVLFNKLKKGAIVGTDSTRRKAQILEKRPDLIVTSIRGNVDTRISKLERGEYDGIFLAAAGLKRLGLQEKIIEYFSEENIVPAPGQGALAVVIKRTNKDLFTKLQEINNKELMSVVNAERSFSKFLEGGCSSPIGAFAKCSGKEIILFGFIGSLDGKYAIRDSLVGNITTPEKLGKELAKRVLQKSKAWYTPDKVLSDKKYVIVTRPEKENKAFIKHLEKMGLHAYSYPTIAISKLKISQATRKYFQDLASFDWILFTSANGVEFFIKALKESKIDLSVLKKVKIAAVGTKTAETLKKQELSVHFIPVEFTTENLTSEFKNIKGKKILLPRADIATTLLIKALEKRGAHVVNMPIYQTKLISSLDKTFENLLESKKILCITFTSPSTVKGFMKNIEEMGLSKSILSISVLAIGPVTTKSLKKVGFQKIYTSDTFTEKGMLEKLKEVIL